MSKLCPAFRRKHQGHCYCMCLAIPFHITEILEVDCGQRPDTRYQVWLRPHAPLIDIQNQGVEQAEHDEGAASDHYVLCQPVAIGGPDIEAKNPGLLEGHIESRPFPVTQSKYRGRETKAYQPPDPGLLDSHETGWYWPMGFVQLVLFHRRGCVANVNDICPDKTYYHDMEKGREPCCERDGVDKKPGDKSS
jgi:hypothetical protein